MKNESILDEMSLALSKLQKVKKLQEKQNSNEYAMMIALLQNKISQCAITYQAKKMGSKYIN